MSENQTEKPTAMLQRLRCKNDPNGNPRRVYALHLDFQAGQTFGTGSNVGCHPGYHKRTVYAEEGYLGVTAGKRLMEWAAVDPVTVADLGDGYGLLSATEYRELAKSPDLVNVHGSTNPATGLPWGA